MIVETSQSTYFINEKEKTFTRTKGNSAPNAYQDGEAVDYLQITRLQVGEPMEILYLDQDKNLKKRITSNVTAIKK